MDQEAGLKIKRKYNPTLMLGLYFLTVYVIEDFLTYLIIDTSPLTGFELQREPLSALMSQL